MSFVTYVDVCITPSCLAAIKVWPQFLEDNNNHEEMIEILAKNR
jgi:hypothetical protein